MAFSGKLWQRLLPASDIEFELEKRARRPHAIVAWGRHVSGRPPVRCGQMVEWPSLQLVRTEMASGLVLTLVYRNNVGIANLTIRSSSLAIVNPHSVERFVHEEHRHQEECDCQHVCEHRIVRS